MQQTIGVAVVAAQLAATDRRALSQAWYSALHLADHAPRTTPARGALAASARIGGSSPLAGSAPPAGISHVPPGGRPAVRAAIPRTASAEAHERRFARTELARSIERGLARRTPRSGAVSFAIRTRGARVMNGPSPLDAYERVLSRAQDLRDAFRAGNTPLNADVRSAPQVVPASDPLSVVPPPGSWLVTRGADGVRAYERDGALRTSALS